MVIIFKVTLSEFKRILQSESIDNFAFIITFLRCLIFVKKSRVTFEFPVFSFLVSHPSLLLLVLLLLFFFRFSVTMKLSTLPVYHLDLDRSNSCNIVVLIWSNAL